MFDRNTRLTKTSNYILLFWFYVRSVPLIYGSGTIGWQNSALDRTSVLFIKFQFYCGRFAALQNWEITITIIWKISTGSENISTQVEIWGHPHSMYAQRGRGVVKPNAYDCVQGGGGGLILAIFVRTNYVMTPIKASKNRIFRRLMKWKNRIKRTKMLLKINKEFVSA